MILRKHKQSPEIIMFKTEYHLYPNKTKLFVLKE